MVSRTTKIVSITGIVLVIGITLACLPMMLALYELYWGRDQLHTLLYEDVGLNDSTASVLAVVGSFIYAIVWIPLSMWVWKLFFWRFDLKQLAIMFGCWVLIYGHVPFIHAVFSKDICFNQRTGASTKWYIQAPNGEITLSDNAGYDAVFGVAKQPATQKVCALLSRQKSNGHPNKITSDVGSIQYFDPNTGNAKVWFTMDADNNYVLFDASGFNPTTGEALRAMTPATVSDILSRQAKAKAADKAASAEREAKIEAQRLATIAADKVQAAAVEAQRLAADAAERKAQAQKAKDDHVIEIKRQRAAALEAARIEQVAAQTAAAVAENLKHQHIQYTNGDRYDGELENGMKNGHGVYTFANGTRYDGQWINDAQNGNGVNTRADGHRYDGEFLNNTFNGHGVYTVANNGAYYDGQWLNGKFISGTVVCKDGLEHPWMGVECP
jgi:hypothetical protein